MPSTKTDKDGRKPKHGMDKKRSNKEVGYMRSASTVRRLKMYNSGKAVRNKEGKVISQELQSKDLPTTRIMPDRRWFGNTRVIGQKQLESFRDQMADKVDNPFMVLLREKKLPMQLLEDPEAKVDRKRKRKDVLQQFSFSDTFGKKSSQRQKRPKLSVESYDDLLAKAGEGQDHYTEKYSDTADAYAKKDQLEFAAVKQHVLAKGQSKRIWGELYKVVDSSDVIIQILDARNPEGTRCKFLEQHLKKNHKHKHMIFLLNKVDLVPSWNAKRWLHHLSKEYPVLAFHASITNPFGKGALLSLLRQLARLRSDKKAIAVGFVGYPNVGKSSVINTLRTKKVCNVAPVPGETKVWQYITLMKRVFLIDCPGVVYNDTKDSEVDTVLKGVVRIERLEDATVYVPEVLRLVKPEYLKRAYTIKHWEDTEDFLSQLARNTGKLIKGGDPDLNTAAKMVLLDWQRGRLPYFSTPPGYSSEPPTSKEELPEQTTAPIHAVTAEDASRDAQGVPEQAAQAAETLVQSAMTAVAEQQRSAIPTRGEYFTDKDAGPEGAAAAVAASDDDAVSLDLAEGDEEDKAASSSDHSSDDEAGSGEEKADDDDEAAGYGEGGLSWEAVMAQVMGGDETGALDDESDGGEEAAGLVGSSQKSQQPEEEDGVGRGKKKAKGTARKGKTSIKLPGAGGRRLSNRKAQTLSKQLRKGPKAKSSNSKR